MGHIPKEFITAMEKLFEESQELLVNDLWNGGAIVIKIDSELRATRIDPGQKSEDNKWVEHLEKDLSIYGTAMALTDKEGNRTRIDPGKIYLDEEDNAKSGT